MSVTVTINAKPYEVADEHLEMSLLRYLREERTFPDPEALKKQISLDVTQIRCFFEQHSSNSKR